MQCKDDDRVKPLDELFEDQIEEFDSGEEKACNRDLDRMIWELGDYENEEPLPEAGEFDNEQAIEEELVEKRIIRGINGEPSFVEGGWAEEEILPG
ncbi:MAG: hypothetical protein CSYNP_03517 [Syntrophus sp. SKADARSKE-3]|nr:hypothetical protein [Syntrophus sp. SKADARSKE-3]